MGSKGKEIVELAVDELVAELKKAYLDELLAFYSYWITEVVAEGFHGEELAEHFADEAKDELAHARKLADRVAQLDGDPAIHPKNWEAGANAPWTAPRHERSDADGIVEDQIRAQRGAIETYNRLAHMTFGKDPVTYAIATELRADEVRHEEFLENLLSRKKH